MSTTAISIKRIRCESYESSLGISHSAPRLSWELEGDAVDWLQTKYTVRVIRGTDVEEASVETAQSTFVDWPSRPLQSRERVTIELRLTGSDGLDTAWKSFEIETGLIQREDWTAQLVGGEKQAQDGPKRPFRLRSSFLCPAEFRQARLYITAHGIYEPYINGIRVGEALLEPGWTDYRFMLRYGTHDVTDLVKRGETNTIGAWLGEGWYSGRLGFRDGVRNVYGTELGLLAQLEIDGKVVASTGEDWSWSYGNIVASELMDGETFDSQISDDWDSTESWNTVVDLPFPSEALVSAEAAPVHVMEQITAKSIATTPSGKTVVDFGQNFAGLLQILGEPSNKSGELVLRYAEVMEHGELGTRPLRAAKATDRIVLGGSVRGYRSKFTTHGFRYMEVTGWSDITVNDVVGLVISSLPRRTGYFECSHKLLNRLHQNVVYSTLANTISLPTDCPQRDERLGWTGDIQVFAPTLNFLFDSSGFLRDWLKDLYEAQKSLDGIVPIIVPTLPIENLQRASQAAWGDASAITPWDLYMSSGDTEVLRDQYPSMCLWLEEGVIRDPVTGLWTRDKPQLGDWLDPKAPPSLPGRGSTDPFLVADAYLVYVTRKVGLVAKVLGESAAAEKWDVEARRLLDAFHDNYVTRNNRLVSDSQSAFALLLHFDLVDPNKPDQRDVFSKRLEELVVRDFWQVATGFVGTPIILHTLVKHGMLHHAYRMLLARDCPSWLSPVLLGATTIWERWDSMLADGSINPGNMTSFNHYALGAVAEFLHSVVAGLSPLSPGWKTILIKPQPGGDLTWAKASHHSPYGLAECQWRIEAEQLFVTAVIPPNCTARVELPGVSEEVGSGIHDFNVPWVADARWPPEIVQPEFSRPVDKDWVRG